MSIAKRLHLPALITLSEASRILHVHPNTLRIWERRGRIQSIRIGPRGDRNYSREEILRFISSYKKFSLPDDAASPQEESMSQLVVNRLIQKFDRLQIMTTALGTLFETPEIITESLKQMRYISKGDVSFILRLNKEETRLDFWGSDGDKLFSKELKTVQVRYLPPAGHVIQTKEPAILQINGESLRRYPQILYYPTLLSYKSFIFAPIINSGKVTGILGIAYREKKQFIKEDMIFILAISRECSQALERAVFYEKEKKMHQSLLETHVLLKKVNQSAIRFLKANELNEVYRLIVEEARKLIGAEYGSVFLSQDGELTRAYASDPILFEMQARPRGDTYRTYLERRAKTYVVKRDHEPHPMLIDLGVKSVIRIPLYFEDKSMGVLNMLLLKRERITDDELRVLEFFGVLATLAIIQSSG